MPTTIKQQRTLIDRIDREILALLGKRMRLVGKIGKAKRASGLPALDAKRWQQMVAKRRKQALASKLDPEVVEKIYAVIHRYSLDLEKNQ